MQVVLYILIGMLAFSAPCFCQHDSSLLIMPEDLTYKGAFKLPEGGSGNRTWGYGGSALAFYPNGNPGGPSDGYPGSLYGTGHIYELLVSEVSIPVPVISKNAGSLNTASTLQGFSSITGGVTPSGSECVVAGLEYLPPQGSQAAGKLYYVQGHHWMEFDALGTNQPTLWWADLNLSNPHPSGPWRLGTTNSYNTCGYAFEIPGTWAASHVTGNILGVGNHREARGGCMGPALYSCAPWEEGNPPSANTSIAADELVKYGTFDDPQTTWLDDYRHSDTWGGGAWLESSGRSGVVIAGSKGLGNEYYGDNPQGKGWYCDDYACEFLFYDPADYASVVAGSMEPYEVQPYAVLNVEPLMFQSSGYRAVIGGVAYDRAHNKLYVSEMTALPYGYPVIHVWELTTPVADVTPSRNDGNEMCIDAWPNPFNPAVTIRIKNQAPSTKHAEIRIYNMNGTQVFKLGASSSLLSAGLTWDASEQPSGVYIASVRVGNKWLTRQLVLAK